MKRYNYDEIIPNSVGGFLGYFKYANYVVNVSFHGTVFSVIFKKDFYTLKSKNYERAYGLLNSLNLLSRFVSPDEKVQLTHVNYLDINDKLKKMRLSSIDFINSSLNN